MDPLTQQQLRALDRQFYDQCADTFSATRQSPWSGFDQIVQSAPVRPRILDAGCGNGRFAKALAGHVPVTSYVGVDGSDRLLDHGRTLALPFPADFLHADLLEEDTLPKGSFDLVVVLGVMHHIPGRDSRARLLRALSQRVARGGLLAVSFFRYERSARIARRALVAGAPGVPHSICSDALEPGDRFLPFGDTGRLRYCHRFEDTELDRLACLPGLVLCSRFSPQSGSDKLNEYLLLSRPA